MKFQGMGKGTDQMISVKPGLKSIVFVGIMALVFFSVLSGQEKMLAIKAGKIQTIKNGIIENGVILIQDDRIIEIGSEIEVPADAEVFDFSGKFIMPGIVSPDSNLGMPQPSLEELMEAARSGPAVHNLAYYPVLYSIYPEHPDYLMALKNGFTSIAVSPLPAGIAGLGAVIKPLGETLKDILIKDKAFLKINVYVNTPFWDAMKKALDEAQKKVEEEKKKKEEEMKEKNKKDKGKNKEKDKEKQEEQKEEERISESTKIFMEVVEGKLPILAECSTPDATSHLLALISGYPKVKVVVRGGPDVYKAGSLLKGKNISVILDPVIGSVGGFHGRVERTNFVLKCQGLDLKLAFQAPGGIDDQIHLFDYLNKLSLYGVKEDVLLKGVTIVPAEILGIDKLVGSLEKGKRADLIVFKNDPLKNVPAIEKVMLGGRFVQ
jgi:imidazolonepropionase-like amidohydrolase